MTVLGWIEKNSKEGANLEEVKKLLKETDPLASIQTKEDALVFIRKNDLFANALQYEITTKIEAHDKKFMENKFPDLIKIERDKLMKELKPEETAEQKRIRELEERLQKKDEAEKQQAIKEALRLKAKALEYDPLKAERYYVFGDAAEKEFEKDVKEIKAQITSEIDRISKQRFANTAPAKNSGPEGKTMPREEFEQMSPMQKADFIKAGGKPINQ